MGFNMVFCISSFGFCLRVPYIVISNGNRTEFSSIRSVIIRVITKSEDRAVITNNRIGYDRKSRNINLQVGAFQTLLLP